MAHFYIKYVFVPMEAEGLLKVPEFVNSTEWSWSKPEDMPCEFNENTLSPVMQFLYNSLQQDYLKVGQGLKLLQYNMNVQMKKLFQIYYKKV